MNEILLTPYPGRILGPIALLMGKIMNVIFNLIDAIPFVSGGQIGLSIIVFTIVMHIAMLPLTIRQQRFSKLQARMQPELKAIQDKYKGRRDQEASMLMNEEMKAVYTRYGVSQTGSCVQLLIQLPIMLALYRVIYAIPAYVDKIRAVYLGADSIVTKLTQDQASFETSRGVLEKLTSYSTYQRQFEAFNAEGFSLTESLQTVQNSFIDVLNRASSLDWEVFRVAINDRISGLNDIIISARNSIASFNSFLGLNIGNSPWYYISNRFFPKDIAETYDLTGLNTADISVPQISMGIVVAAVLIPVLAAATQMINVKLMPTARASGDPNDPANQMNQSMRTMNTVMPLMSAYFCFVFPAGIGLYWIAGSVVRSVEQIFINRHIDKMDIDAQIAKNEEKYKEKLEKSKEKTAQMQKYAALNTRNTGNVSSSFPSLFTQEEKDAAIAKTNEIYESEEINPGSLLAKANLVREYNNRGQRDNRKKPETKAVTTEKTQEPQEPANDQTEDQTEE